MKIITQGKRGYRPGTGKPQRERQLAQTQEPIVVNRQAREPRKTLKVVTFNARGGRCLRGILTCLKRPPLAEADVILLCDVDWWRKGSYRREIARELASALRMSFAYIPDKLYSDGFASLRGNAILASQPLKQVRAIPLGIWQQPRFRGEAAFVPRGGLASANFNGRCITLGVAHLSSRRSPAGREQQIRTFIAALPVHGAALIGGDFNTATLDLSGRSGLLKALLKSILQPSRFRSPETHEPLFQHLHKAGFDFRSTNVPLEPTFTFNSAVPPFLRPKLDWLAVRQLSAVPGSASVVRARPRALG